MCIGKGRVDLYGSGVTLDGTRHISHLLQRVPHVAVGICKGRLDPIGAGMGRKELSTGNTCICTPPTYIYIYVAGAVRNGKLGIPWRLSVFHIFGKMNSRSTSPASFTDMPHF